MTTSNLLIVVLLGATLGHGVYRISAFLAPQGPLYADSPAAIGNVIEAHVYDMEREVGLLAAGAAGHCRLVIVGSSSCNFSKAQAVAWTVAGLRDGPRLMPDGWEAVWVLVEEEGELASEFLDPMFPVRRVFPVNNREFMLEAGVQAFPYHIVLDREGRVVQSGRGAELPARGDLLTDCSIAGKISDLTSEAALDR